MNKRTFSERHGFKKSLTELQTDGLNKDTRSRIWNYITGFFETLEVRYGWLTYKPFIRAYFDEILKIDASQVHEGNAKSVFNNLKQAVDERAWYSVYDLIQFIADYCSRLSDGDYYRSQFIAGCNSVLKSELAGYCFIDVNLCPITEDAEVAEIKLALKDESPDVREHLTSSIKLLSDRNNPDFRNSVKESISALESVFRKATGESTLGKALKKLSSAGIELNPQLASGLASLYAWTNGKDGIRHAIMNDSSVSREDAKLMLIIFSAVTNYVRSKGIRN